ncbi:MAG: hypothetical protein GEU81_01510 [Nitriliruptorales bacterium]|nr:hypothetical protein [Nitriliruptorales bacterium]
METTPVPPGVQSARDIAVHHDIVDPGPGPFTRAVLGLLIGAATGVLTVLLTRRERPGAARRPSPPPVPAPETRS